MTLKRLLKDRKKQTAFVVMALLAIAVILSDYSEYSQNDGFYRDGMLYVHYIDVGQGDATLVRSPDGKHMLIDSGRYESGEYLVKYLKDCGVNRLEYFLITHPHDDHYSGAPDVINEFPVDNFIVHEAFCEEYPYDKLINLLENNRFGADTVIYETELGDYYEFADCADFEIISPAVIDRDNFNECSLSFRLNYGDTAFLFTGDAEKSSEKSMLTRGCDIKADVLKAGHHGSSTSNTRAFVEQVAPEIAVISCGEVNDYGHPHEEVVELFDELNIQMVQTFDGDGGIIISSDGKDVFLVDSEMNGRKSRSFEYIGGIIEGLFDYIAA